MKNINQEKLNKILKEHKLWLTGEGGKRADLSDSNLSNTDLSNTNLTYANLSDSNLSNADLWNTDLTSANLSNTDLTSVNLSNANLEQANLEHANLSNAYLMDADLSGADLKHTNLIHANLEHANLWNANLKDANLENVRTSIHTIGYNLVCPEKGSFIGYKRANGCLVELLILDDAKRSSATTSKCRCDKAKVLDIIDINTGESMEKARSDYDPNFIYEVGEIVSVDNFDDNRWNECGTGIHFFMNRNNALNY